MFALVTAQGYGYAPGVDAGVLCDPPQTVRVTGGEKVQILWPGCRLLCRVRARRRKKRRTTTIFFPQVECVLAKGPRPHIKTKGRKKSPLFLAATILDVPFRPVANPPQGCLFPVLYPAPAYDMNRKYHEPKQPVHLCRAFQRSARAKILSPVRFASRIRPQREAGNEPFLLALLLLAHTARALLVQAGRIRIEIQARWQLRTLLERFRSRQGFRCKISLPLSIAHDTAQIEIECNQARGTGGRCCGEPVVFILLNLSRNVHSIIPTQAVRCGTQEGLHFYAHARRPRSFLLLLRGLCRKALKLGGPVQYLNCGDGCECTDSNLFRTQMLGASAIVFAALRELFAARNAVG